MEQYVIRGGHAGAERLAVLARAWWPTTEALFDRAGVVVGMRCLDLGCGGGDVTLEIARRVGPTGFVTGIDMDEVKLGRARAAAAEQGLSNIEFLAQNVYDFAQLDVFELVYSRFVLQHLSRPVDVLRTMWAAVRVGGVIAVEDADFGGQFSDPPDDGFAFYADAYPRVLERHGGDPLIGRKLHRLFTDAGIAEPEVRVVQRVDRTGEGKTLPYSTVEATAEAIVAEGVATAGQVAIALASLASYATDGSSICGSPRNFQVWSRRSHH